MQGIPRRIERAFTLIELMVVVAVVAVIILLAAPSMGDLIGMYRLRAINDQLVTDLQYMRSEAISRNQYVGFIQRNEAGESLSCYVVFSSSVDPQRLARLDETRCNCASPVGSVCTGTQREMRTVQIPRDLSVQIRVHSGQRWLLAMSPITGGAEFKPIDTSLIPNNEYCVEVTRTPRGRLRTGVSRAGRPTVCSPDSSVIGVPACPPHDPAVKNCEIIP
jgi:type IV fimbrial biogenesis protein FimT